MKHVLVTGGNGFIGRWVVRRLVADGYEVAVLDTRNREPEAGASLVLGDIRDATAVTEAVAHADGVIHLAGVLGTAETVANPRPAAETNILGGLNVLEAIAQYRLPAVNIAVGNYWMNNTYSITKNAVERFADMMNRYRGTRISVVRALNAYGPGQSAAAPFGPSKVRKIMPSFICRALSGLPIEVYGDGEQIMDMVWVGDVADVLVAALEHTEAHGPITCDAGTGRPTTVNEIAGIVADAAGGYVEHLPMRPGEDERSVVLGDPATLEPLGITDLRVLEDGVADTVAYFRGYLG
ncbi:MAG: NAD-dependent epimerase/dehydratase family protein [Opitutales bacterium]